MTVNCLARGSANCAARVSAHSPTDRTHAYISQMERGLKAARSTPAEVRALRVSVVGCRLFMPTDNAAVNFVDQLSKPRRARGGAESRSRFRPPERYVRTSATLRAISIGSIGLRRKTSNSRCASACC